MKERWFEKHRMEWIEEMLHVYGFINRGHLMRKFDLSTAQASHDLQNFQTLHPDAMLYDLTRKQYVVHREYGVRRDSE